MHKNQQNNKWHEPQGFVVQEIWNHGPHKNRPQSAEIEQAESSEGKKKKYMNEITLSNERVYIEEKLKITIS